MTNLEFIEKEFYNPSRLEKTHGSLFRDSDGNIYSYGYHYPLLFTATDNDTLVFINTTGYSNTTARHIHHAWKAVDYKAIGVKLNGERHHNLTLSRVKELLQKERDGIVKEMQSKKRKNTEVYRQLFRALNTVDGYIQQVNEARN